MAFTKKINWMINLTRLTSLNIHNIAYQEQSCNSFFQSILISSKRGHEEITSNTKVKFLEDAETLSFGKFFFFFFFFGDTFDKLLISKKSFFFFLENEKNLFLDLKGLVQFLRILGPFCDFMTFRVRNVILWSWRVKMQFWKVWVEVVIWKSHGPKG